MTYQFIAQHQQEFPVQRMCRVLDVSESGYYAWKHRKPSQRTLADEQLATRIHEAHEASHHMYGSRRIHAELLEQGGTCGRKRVVRLMRQLGICSRLRRRRIKTTDSQHADPVAENLLGRNAHGRNAE